MSKGNASRPGGKDLMSQMQNLQDRLMKAQNDLATEMVEASAGGGAVVVRMSGTQECHQVVIDASLLESGDVEMLQDLLMLAVNQAIHDSQVMAARRLGPLAGGMGVMGGDA
jgi:DNA-binding YbaB/EbfC family protein